MEVILKEDVADLGFRGEVVKVADGYARNYLLPRKLAMQATAANKAVIEQMKSAAARRSASEKAQAEDLLTQLEPLVLSFTRKSGEGGHLFGSVTSSDIAAELAAQGHEVDRRKIQLGDPIKSRGRLQGGHPAAPRSHRARDREGPGRSDRRRQGSSSERRFCGNCVDRRGHRACSGRSNGRIAPRIQSHAACRFADGRREIIGRSQALKARDRFFAQECRLFPYAAALPQSCLCWDCTRASVNHPRVSDNSHASASGEAEIRASLHRDGFLDGFWRNTAQAVFAPVRQNQPNGFAEAGTTFLHGAALSIRARDFGRPGNKPLAVPLNDRSELIPHG